MDPETMARVQAILAERPAIPDFDTVTADELATFRDAENAFRTSDVVREFAGRPDPGAAITGEQLPLPGRVLPVRVYRPRHAAAPRLPLVVYVHGGGFVGTAVQAEWLNAHLAVRLSAVVVSVEHRLLDFDTPLSAAADDGWDSLAHVRDHAVDWGIDPDRVAVLGESAGGLISALSALRAKAAGVALRAQVLVNPCVDVTDTAMTYDSAVEFAKTPTLDGSQVVLFRRLAVPEGADAAALSPLYAEGVDGLADALVVVPTADPIADHGRVYARRLERKGTAVELAQYPGAGHGFLSTPGLAPQAAVARDRIAEFLAARLGGVDRRPVDMTVR